MNTYYWSCPQCGANLDPGERCECELKHKEVVKRTASTYLAIEREDKGHE